MQVLHEMLLQKDWSSETNKSEEVVLYETILLAESHWKLEWCLIGT